MRLTIGILAAFALIQLIPYGRAHTNPPLVAEPEWDSEATAVTFYRVCGDCHSNQTEWPWYSHIAPVSWLVQHDVDEGREHFDVTRWGVGKQHGDEAAEMVRADEMPLWFYRPLHPEVALSDDERAAFIEGLVRTFGDEANEESGEDGAH